jgi:malate dehydrogenase (oxaloacetate-decarboxylating)(NADP+)
MAPRPLIFAMANPDPEIAYPDAVAARPDAIVATGRSDYPNQVNNVLGFPYIFRGALDVRATTISEEMKVAAARALAALAHEPVTERVLSAYGERAKLKFGPEYLIPTPFDERALFWVAPAVAEAAMKSGVARVPIEIDAYRERLRRRTGDAAYPITRGMIATARENARRIVFPDAANPKLLRALQVICEESICTPVLLGRRDEIAAACEANDLDLMSRDLEIIDPVQSPRYADYVAQYYALRQRKGVTMPMARKQLVRSNPFGLMMVKNGDADGLVGGLSSTYAETIRPALQILGIRPDVKVAMAMHMMVLKDGVKFFADATINIDPDAGTLADIALQTADAVAAMGVTPRVAMISFTNFGTVDHAISRKVQAALALVRAARPDLEIDGEMQADVALDRSLMETLYPFSRLTDAANVLIFPTLTSANTAYKVLQTVGGATALGPILLGVARPVTVLQAQAPVSDIVTMTAFTCVMGDRRVAPPAR